MVYSIGPFGLSHTKSREKLDEELIDAVWKGQIRQIRSLVRQGANPDARRGHQERTMLILACERSNLAMAQTLIKAGAHADLPDNEMNTPLHVAAQGSSHELMDLLVKKGARLEAKNSSGRTPMHTAAELGKAENVEKLVQMGGKIDAKMPTGITPLHLATIYGSAKTVAMLLKLGADPMAKTDKGITPAHLAAKTDNADVKAAYQAHFSLKHSNRIHRLNKKRTNRPKPV